MTQSSRTKVLFLITKSDWGGAQRYVFDLASSLDLALYEPVVVLGGAGELQEKLAAAGIRTITLHTLQRDISLTKEVRFFAELYKIVRNEDPDVLHVNSSKAGGVGCFVGRLLGVRRVIFTAHGWAFNEDRPGWQKFIIKYFHWLTVLLSHHTIAVSSSIVRQMNWPLARKKLQVIHLGRSLPSVADTPSARAALVEQAASRSLVLPNHPADLWIGSIAELHHIKRINVLIDAVKELVATFPTLRYVAIHDGEERAALEQQIITHNLTDHVFLINKIPEAARLIPAFDVFVLPSKSEAFGYVLVEAGLAGVAVVASNVGGIPDVVIDEKTGLLVAPNDHLALAGAIAKLLSDDTYRAQLATANHDHAQIFTIEAMIEKTLELYT